MRRLFALLLVPLSIVPARCEQIAFDAARDWQRWQLPLGAVELTTEGSVRPLRIRKDVNAALDASAFGGGIRRAGSNLADAPLLIDGDAQTGWAPREGDIPGNAFVEIDLGRAVSVRRVRLVFAADGPPFELFDLLMSTGEHEIDQVGNPIESTVVYRIFERYKENRRQSITYELDQPEHTPIRFLMVKSLAHVPGARLAEVEVEAIGDNLLARLIERGGSIDIVTDVERSSESVTLGNALSLIDGDLTTRFFQRNEPRAAIDIHGHITMDLGAVYWIDLVRIIGGVVVRSGYGGGITTARFVSRRSFIFKFYEVLSSDGSLAPDGSRIWTRHFSGFPGEETQLRGMADHSFPLIPARFVRIRWRVWDASCAFGIGGQAFTSRNCLVTGTTEELHVFGEGYPREVGLRSPLIDLGGNKNLNALHWRAEVPPGARLEMRTRTGNEVEALITFRDKDGKEVTQKRWEKLIPSFRGPVDTALVAGGDWSPWSEIYAEPGQAFLSPSPRRFMEVDVRLVSARQAAPSLESLAIDFTPPLAGRAVAEITPLEVAPGQETEFSYFLRTEDAPLGFDQLALEASTPLRFLSARVEDSPVEVLSEKTEKGFRLSFPQPLRGDQLVELRFAAAVFLHSTRFDAFLEDSRRPDAGRQPVDAGDAIPLVESNTTAVRLPIGRDLLTDLQVDSPVLTPNGDGVNDEWRLSLDLVNVLTPRPLRLRLYDLSGRLVREIARHGTAGQQHFSWDGRDERDQAVPPGLYLAELSVDGDAGEERRRLLVTVAY